MRTDSEWFYDVSLACAMLRTKGPLSKSSNGLHLIFFGLSDNRINYQQLHEIIDAIRKIAASHSNLSEIVEIGDLGFLRFEGRIRMGFYMNPAKADKCEAILPELLADQIQALCDHFDEVKTKEISTENGFYSYWHKQGVNPSKLNCVFLRMLSHSQTLQYPEVTECWDLIRNDLIFNHEFSFAFFEEMVNLLCAHYANLEELDKNLEANAESVKKGGQEHYHSFGREGRGGNSYGWSVVDDDTVRFYDLGSGSTKSYYCSIREIATELESLLLRFYAIVEKETP